MKTCGVPGFAATAADGAGYESSALLLQSHLTEWLGNSRAVSPTVRCAADDVAAWSAAEGLGFVLAAWLRGESPGSLWASEPDPGLRPPEACRSGPSKQEGSVRWAGRTTPSGGNFNLIKVAPN